MDFELLVIMAFISGLITLLVGIISIEEGFWCKFVVCVAGLVLVLCISGTILYGIAGEQIDYELVLPVHNINGAQYIQYQDPDTSEPIIHNVNKMFERNFDETETIKVTIFKDGPYNGVYKRPSARIELSKLRHWPSTKSLDNKCPKCKPSS